MRQIALDTETTGKSDDGTPGDHRIIEVGCVEIVDRKITGRTLQLYINPGRPVDEEAVGVHGITDEFLADKPVFSEIAGELISFIRGSELLIHNARFDTSFLDKEWQLLNLPERTADLCTITDTVALSRKINPNNQANLDNLCHLYDIDTSRRTLHGALLDAELLAEVYLAMTGGQSSFDFGEESAAVSTRRWQRPQGAKLPVMSVEPARHAVHVMKVIELAQKVKFRTLEDGTVLSGSHFGPQFDMPFLEKTKEEGKKEFAARQKTEREEKLHALLSDSELTELQSYLDHDKAAQLAWEERVKNGISA